MKAIVYTRYGPPEVLQLKDVDKPRPRENELLVRVRAASINAFDWRHVKPDPFFIRLVAGLLKPKHPILGADIAGQVEAVGSSVKQFKPGDEVFGVEGYGGYAEYACVRESRFILKPSGLTFEDAAAVPMAALTALQGLRDKGLIHAGQKVLINGAAGGVGTFAVQIAKSFGTEVTGVCSTSKLDLVRAIGADHVVDYKKEDVTRSADKFDLIFDTAAYRPIANYKRILSNDGIYVMAGGAASAIFQLLFQLMIGVKSMKFVSTKVVQQDLQFIAELMVSGKVKSIIDKRFPLPDTADALRYVQDGHVRGKVVIVI